MREASPEGVRLQEVEGIPPFCQNAKGGTDTPDEWKGERWVDRQNLHEKRTVPPLIVVMVFVVISPPMEVGTAAAAENVIVPVLGPLVAVTTTGMGAVTCVVSAEEEFSGSDDEDDEGEGEEGGASTGSALTIPSGRTRSTVALVAAIIAHWASVRSWAASMVVSKTPLPLLSVKV